MLGGEISTVNGQDQTVQSGNYCYSSIKVVSIDSNDNLKSIYKCNTYIHRHVA